MVTGAFSDCLGPDARPFNDAVAPFLSRGYRIDTAVVSGRSSATHNARQLAEAVERLEVSADDRLVLLGYSKGAVDILHFLVEYPRLAARVAAVVSVSGPIFGTPAASAGRWAYDSLLAGTFAGHCDPGDGGVLDSLLPEVRRQWLAEHTLPTGVRYFSLAAFTTEEHLARGLRASWQLLARHEPRNDGQVTIADAMIPGSTLLGYVNADHWGAAIRVENELPFLAKRPSARAFPHEPLLEAILLVVDASLGR